MQTALITTCSRALAASLLLLCACLEGTSQPTLSGAGQTPQPTPSASDDAMPTASPTPASSASSPTPTPSSTLPPSCATAHLAVCDDFESQAVGDAPSSNLWRVSLINAQESITVGDTYSYRGKQALHVHTTNQGFERAEIVNTSMFPAPSNNFFGRMFVYFDSDVPQIHCNIVRGAGLRTGETQQASYNVGTQYQLMIDNYYDANNASAVIDEGKHAGVNVAGMWQNATYLPSRTWGCLEWQFDGAHNTLHVWLDGTALTLLDTINGTPALSTEQPWLAPAFSEIGLGWTVVGNTENFDHFDMWLDAVALDANRIGCAN